MKTVSYKETSFEVGLGKGEIVVLLFLACLLSIDGATIDLAPADTVRYAGESHTFACRVDSLGGNDLIWERQGRYQDSREKIYDSSTQETIDQEKFEIPQLYDLMVKNIQLEDAGTYYCRLGGQEKSAHLIVIDDLNATVPKVVDKDKHVILQCEVKFLFPRGAEQPQLRGLVNGEHTTYTNAEHNMHETGWDTKLEFNKTWPAEYNHKYFQCEVYVTVPQYSRKAQKQLQIQTITEIRITGIGEDSGVYTKSTELCYGKPVYSRDDMDAHIWWYDGNRTKGFWRTGGAVCMCKGCGRWDFYGDDICSVRPPHGYEDKLKVECLLSNGVTAGVAIMTLILLSSGSYLLQRLL